MIYPRNQKLYLASPLFTDFEKETVQYWAKRLRELGNEVYVPMEHNIENAWDYSNHTWAKMVFEEDVRAIRECDEIVCIYYGLYSDSGTAWECGFAYGIGKDVMLIDQSNNETSLMVVNGSINPRDFWGKNQT